MPSHSTGGRPSAVPKLVIFTVRILSLTGPTSFGVSIMRRATVTERNAYRDVLAGPPLVRPPAVQTGLGDGAGGAPPGLGKDDGDFEGSANAHGQLQR